MPPQSQTAARPPRIRLPATTARGSPYGVPAALLLHGLAVAALLFSFRGFVPPSESNMVPVDLVTIAEVTNVAAAAPSEPQQEAFERPPLQPLEAPPVPDMVEPAPVDVKPPEFKIQQPKPDTRQDISHLLDQLTQPERAPRNAARTAPRAAEAIGAGNAASASLADALRSQIRNCWSPIPGAPNPADQVVSFGLRLNRDGTVAELELLTLDGNVFTRAAVDAAQRAIYQCQPYRLPPDRYAQWQEFRPLRFDPRQMLPQ